MSRRNYEIAVSARIDDGDDGEYELDLRAVAYNCETPPDESDARRLVAESAPDGVTGEFEWDCVELKRPWWWF